jgi:hypothetical protein
MEPSEARQERDTAVRLIQRAIGLIGEITSQSGIDHALACTSEAREQLDQALNELMAAAVIEGQSLRSVAAQVGLAPNSVAARLAKSSGLSAYSSAGRVSAPAVHQARADKAPLRFQRRRPTS